MRAFFLVNIGVTLFAMIFLSACMTLNYVASPNPISLPVGTKHNMAVELRVSNELREAKWSDEFDISIGAALERNAEKVARSVFREVLVRPARSGFSNNASVASLTPRLIAIARDRPARVTQDQRTNIFLEWSLKDPQGKPIWVETLIGHGHAAMSSADVQIDAALKDLFEKSFYKMTQSPEIRAYAEN